MDEIFLALANKHRRKILSLLTVEMRVGELLNCFDGEIAQPTLSSHLAMLRKLKLVKSKTRHRDRLYSLDQSGVLKLKKACDDISNQLLDILPRVR